MALFCLAEFELAVKGSSEQLGHGHEADAKGGELDAKYFQLNPNITRQKRQKPCHIDGGKRCHKRTNRELGDSFADATPLLLLRDAQDPK